MLFPWTLLVALAGPDMETGGRILQYYCCCCFRKDCGEAVDSTDADRIQTESRDCGSEAFPTAVGRGYGDDAAHLVFSPCQGPEGAL